MDMSNEHQQLANVIGLTIAKRYHIDSSWFKIHLVDKPEDVIQLVGGTRVEIICGYSVMNPHFMEDIERAIKMVTRVRISHNLVVRNSIIEMKHQVKSVVKHGDMDNLLEMALPKNRLRYRVIHTREVIGEDISTGYMHTIKSTNGNDTEEELVMRLRIEMGKLCGYGDDND